MSGTTESELVARAHAGDFTAFEALVAPHERRLYALARHLVGRTDAEDALQSGLLAALESFRSFRGEAAFGTWLTRIVTNAALKLLRARRVRRAVPLDADGDDGPLPRPEYVADWREDPVRAVENRELRALLDEALAELPEHHRTVFALRDIAGLSTDEAAQALEITPANVKIRLLRARLALRERLTRALGRDETRVPIPADHSHADNAHPHPSPKGGSREV